MYKDVLRAMDGIELYPVFSLVVFVLFFTSVFLWVVRMQRSKVETLASMPLDDGTLSPSSSTGDVTHG